MIFETHAHYDDERFEEDRDALITSMPGRGVGTIINVGASIESTKTTLALSEKYPFVYAAVGVHPSDISGLNEETFAWLKEQTKKEKVAAVGEIGLDYYWDKEPEVQKQQRYWFAEQMKMAREASLPVIIHSRDAAADTMEVMKSVHAEEIPGVIHCYSYKLLEIIGEKNNPYFFCEISYTCTIFSRSSTSPSFDNTRFACMP